MLSRERVHDDHHCDRVSLLTGEVNLTTATGENDVEARQQQQQQIVGISSNDYMRVANSIHDSELGNIDRTKKTSKERRRFRDDINDINDINDRGDEKSCMRSMQQFCYSCSGVDSDDDDATVTSKMRYTLAESTLAVTIYYAFQYIIHNPTCNFLFKCGCTWTWAGGWNRCNIWNSSGPKCPWCMSRAYVSWTTDYLVFAIMLITFLFCLHRRKRVHYSIRLLSPIIMYFVSSIIVGLAFKIATNYPYFIF